MKLNRCNLIVEQLLHKIAAHFIEALICLRRQKKQKKILPEQTAYNSQLRRGQNHYCQDICFFSKRMKSVYAYVSILFFASLSNRDWSPEVSIADDEGEIQPLI